MAQLHVVELSDDLVAGSSIAWLNKGMAVRVSTSSNAWTGCGSKSEERGASDSRHQSQYPGISASTQGCQRGFAAVKVFGRRAFAATAASSLGLGDEGSIKPS